MHLRLVRLLCVQVAVLYSSRPSIQPSKVVTIPPYWLDVLPSSIHRGLRYNRLLVVILWQKLDEMLPSSIHRGLRYNLYSGVRGTATFRRSCRPLFIEAFDTTPTSFDIRTTMTFMLLPSSIHRGLRYNMMISLRLSLLYSAVAVLYSSRPSIQLVIHW